MKDSSKKLNQYKGKLTPAQIAQGMNAAKANARRLANTAGKLLEMSDCSLAASIAILSIEEAGKCSILRSLALARDDKELKQCWHQYRSHTQKNVMGILPQLVANGARRLDDFAPLFAENAEHPFLLDNVKQIGFYTDCLGNAHWSIPIEVIDRELAVMLVQTAQIMSEGRDITEAEIELWIKHLGPVWKGPKELMEHALVCWHKEMQERGLISASKNEMEEFILKGISLDSGHK